MADSLELTYEAANGSGQRVINVETGERLGQSPALLAFRRNGKDCLIINTPDGAIILRGGDLEVRPEGIIG